MARKKLRYTVVAWMAILIALLSLSFTLPQLCVKTISNANINHTLSQRILDVVFDQYKGVTNSQYIEFEDSIGQSAILESINSQYLAKGIDYIVYHKDIVNDLNDEFDDFYRECANHANSIFKLHLTNSQKKSLMKIIKTQTKIDSVYKNFLKSIEKNISSNRVFILKIYLVFTSLLMKIFIIVFIVLLFLLLLLHHDSKNYIFNDSCKSLVIAGIIDFILISLIRYIEPSFTKRILGFQSSIYTDALFNLSLIIMIVGCVGTIGSYLYMYKYWATDYR